MSNTLIAVILDRRREKDEGTYPVKVRVTHNRKQVYLSANIDLYPDEWEQYLEMLKEETERKINPNITRKKFPKEMTDLKSKLTAIEGKVIDIVNSMKAFSSTELKNKYTNNKLSAGSLINLYNEYIKLLYKEEGISTAKSYECSLTSLKDYKLSFKNAKEVSVAERLILREKVKLEFEDITVDFLKGYETWMEKEGNSMSTVGIYLRPLRAIINLAIKDKLIDENLYPFGKGEYEIPSSSNIKKSLTIEDVRKIANYPLPDNSSIKKARDFWVFSYLCNGINPKDIIQLRFSNIDGDFVEFNRAKTKTTSKKNSKPIRLYLLPQAREIMNSWAVKDGKSNDYVFSILHDGMTALQKYNELQYFIKFINKYIRQIAKDLKIEKDVTSYVARHTFSTVLKRSGVNTEFISEALGHSDKKTTENYLDSFEKESLKENAQKLL